MIDGYCPSHNHKNEIKVATDQTTKRITIGLGIKKYVYLNNND